jgi:hypothetical protein
VSTSMAVSVYIAAPLGEFPLANLIANELRSAGYRVVSTWHADMAPGCKDPEHPKDRMMTLLGNVQELHRADLLVAWTASGTPKATIGEIVYMLALGRPAVWIQGPDRAGANLWDAHPLCEIVPSIQAADVLHAVERAKSRIDRSLPDVPAWLEAPLKDLLRLVANVTERWPDMGHLRAAENAIHAALKARKEEA